MSKRVYITSAFQCPRARLDVSRLSQYFKINGWEITKDPAEADFAAVGACAFTKSSENGSLSYIRNIKYELKPGAPMVVCGCIAGIRREKVTTSVDGIPVDIVSGEHLDKLISAQIPLKSLQDANSIDYTLDQTNDVKNSLSKKDCSFFSKFLRRVFYGNSQANILSNYNEVFYIRVARGCLEDCSYCAIKLASGNLSSKPMDDILQQFEKGLNAGYKAFTLVGEDVGAYGQDIGKSIVDLLSAMLSYEGDYKLVISDCHPRWLIAYCSQLTDLLSSNSAKIGHIEIPIQSGSDRLLDLMRRKYTATDLKASIFALRKAAPSILLKTHVIVGFPGETSEDYRQTLELIQDAKFDHVTCYPYSDRPGTDAHKLPNRVLPWVKTYRHWRCGKQLHS